MTCGCVETCCQVVANCTPEIVNYESGFWGGVTLRVGCETTRYAPAGQAILLLGFGIFLGFLIAKLLGES